MKKFKSEYKLLKSAHMHWKYYVEVDLKKQEQKSG